MGCGIILVENKTLRNYQTLMFTSLQPLVGTDGLPLLNSMVQTPGQKNKACH